MESDAQHHVVIGFRTAAGSAKARWADQPYPPEVGREYDVEIDIGAVGSLKTNTATETVANAGLSMAGDQVAVCADVEALDEDGVAYLRVAPDCLIMLETAGDILAGRRIRLTIPVHALSVTAFGT